MGRNKYSQGEVKEIAKLLRLKNAGNRLQQKQVRHTLRTEFEFNISDFNEPGKTFGEAELYAAIDRGAIVILDDATIPAIEAKSPQRRYARNMRSFELSPAIRLALALIPTDWIYIPNAVFLSTRDTTMIHIAVIIMGVGIGPRNAPMKANDGFLT